ncbi:MAG: hypothetical protein IT391_14955 [Nitrospira sp.]|nr:hypothetical protein [Nitrospira sp.]
MPPQIEQAIRHQLCPEDAGDYALHASIVHLAGVVADHHELHPAVAPPELAFHASALQSTRFDISERPALLSEAQEQLQETVKLFSPVAMAA